MFLFFRRALVAGFAAMVIAIPLCVLGLAIGPGNYGRHVLVAAGDRTLRGDLAPHSRLDRRPQFTLPVAQSGRRSIDPASVHFLAVAGRT